MKLLTPVLLASFLGLGASRPASRYPFDEGDLSALVKLEKSNRLVIGGRLIQLVKEYGIDFEPSEDYLENLRNAGAEKRLLDAVRSAQRVKKPEETAQGAPDVYAVGGEAHVLVPVYKPEPRYSEEAREAKLNGYLALWIVVSPEGKVVDVKEVSQPLGKGLDEEAIQTVRTWKFKPPTRNGAPVVVHTLVEISFSTW